MYLLDHLFIYVLSNDPLGPDRPIEKQLEPNMHQII